MEDKALKLYHGTNCDFLEIDLSKSKDRRDFGKGFYMTTLQTQAKEWAEAMYVRFGGDGVFVYEFELEMKSDLRMKQFGAMSEEWLIFVRDNRTKGGIQHDFDLVRGAVANDKTNRTLALFVGGIYSTKEALNKLQFNKLNDQVSIHTEKALACLTLINKTNYGNEVHL